MRFDDGTGTDSGVLRPPVAGRQYDTALAIIDKIAGLNPTHGMVSSPIIRPVLLQVIDPKGTGIGIVERHRIAAPAFFGLVVIAVLRP